MPEEWVLHRRSTADVCMTEFSCFFSPHGRADLDERERFWEKISL